MRALIDTCVVVDVLQNREPFSEHAKEIFLMLANKRFEGYLSANSVTDIYYLTHRLLHNREQVRAVLKNLFGLFGILDTTALDCRKALTSTVSDFEDAVMCETAERSEMDCIVTRNAKDYVNANVAVLTPEAFLERLI